jgi:hypothetical protein
MSRDGLLAEKLEYKDDTSLYTQPSFDELVKLDIQLNTSELIIECINDNYNDYHQQMDHGKYILWFENRLIKSFNKIYPNKTAIFFVDQCPLYMISNGFPQTTCNKEQIIEFYNKYEIKNITLKRYQDDCLLGPTLTFDSSKFNKYPKKKKPETGGPSKDELYMYLFLFLKKKMPSALEPVIVQIAKKYGHKVLFSCPYNPNDMPSEYLNNHVKLLVKQRCKKNRTISELKTDIRDGFYGGMTRSRRIHKCVDTNMINGWFSKCETNMNREIYDLLGIKDKNIQTLWQKNSEINITDPWIRVPKSEKTLKKLSKQFIIVIDNENQFFV